jgi:hypothetical protein
MGQAEDGITSDTESNCLYRYVFKTNYGRNASEKAEG